jgi:hypothetical protein
VVVQDPLAHLDTLKHWQWYAVGLGLLFNAATAATLTYGVVMELQGTRASLGKCLSAGFARLGPVLGVVIMSSLAIGAGIIALVVPGIILACMFYVSTPVAVIEKPGVFESMSRSKALSQGRKGEIFVILIVMAVIGIIITQIEKTMLVPTDPEAALRALPTLMYIDLGTQVFLAALGSVMSSVAYYYLRLEKEGTSANELAKVFE